MPSNFSIFGTGLPEAIMGIAKTIASLTKPAIAEARSALQKAVNLARGLPAETVRVAVLCLPRFLLLLVKLVKSRKVDDKLRLVCVGAIVSIAVLLAVSISGVSHWFWALVGATVGGPWTAVIAFMASGAINAALIVILMLVTFHICNEVMTAEELRSLAVEAFGPEEGASLIEMLTKLLDQFRPRMVGLASPVQGYLIWVAKRFYNGNMAALEGMAAKAAEHSRQMVAILGKNMRGKRKDEPS